MNHKDRQTLARLYREFFRPRTGLFVLAFFLLVLSSGLAFAQVRLLEPAFDLLLVAGNEAYLLLIPAAMILIGVFKGLVGYTNLLVGARINGSITRQLQQRMFDAVVKADLAWLRREASGQMLARFNEIGAINSIVNGVFTSAVRNTLLIIAYVGNLIYTNWQLALLSLVIIPLAIFPVLSLGRRARKVSKQQLEVGAKFLAFLDENIKGVIQIRLYGIEEQKRQDARDRFRHLYKLGIRATMISGRLLPLMEALTGIAIGLVLWYAGKQIVAGTTSTGEFASFVLALMLAFRPMKEMLGLNVMLQSGLAGTERVLAIFDHVNVVVSPARAYRPSVGFVDHAAESQTLSAAEQEADRIFDQTTPLDGIPEEESTAQNPATAPAPLSPAVASATGAVPVPGEGAVLGAGRAVGPTKETDGTITFTNVRFSYLPEMEPVFTDLNLAFLPGRKNAIVGPTGSGKSTIALLLTRLYDVNSGQVAVDGVDVRDWDIHALRGQFAAVTQETGLFDASFEENITLGMPARRYSVRDATRLAALDEFIDGLPAGLDTIVGERGTRLSGGQRQRLSIARAIYSDARILLLDEATSALDVMTEAAIQSSLDTISSDRTSIIIAHRLSTVRNADCVFVLKDGLLLESGRHEELYALDGYYRGLCNVDLRNLEHRGGRAIAPLPPRAHSSAHAETDE